MLGLACGARCWVKGFSGPVCAKPYGCSGSATNGFCVSLVAGYLCLLPNWIVCAGLTVCLLVLPQAVLAWVCVPSVLPVVSF
jgi:hypothetical protein